MYPIVVSTRGIHRAKPMLETVTGKQSLFDIVDPYFERKYEDHAIDTLQNPSSRLTASYVFEQAGTNLERHRLYHLTTLLFDQDKFARKPKHYFNPLVLLALVFPWVWWNNGSVRLSIICALVLIVIMAARLALLRYLIPTLPFLSLGTAHLLGRLDEFAVRNGPLNMRRALQAIMAACLIYPVVLVAQKWIAVEPLPYLAGRETQVEFISRVGYNNANRTFAHVISFLNQNTRPDEKILFVGEAKGYLIENSYRGDYEQLGRYANSWLKILAASDGDHERVNAMLHEKGFGYLVVNWEYFRWVLGNVELPHPERLEFAIIDLLRFIEKYGNHRFVLRDDPTAQTPRISEVDSVRKFVGDEYWIIRLTEP
jgi:hypothetical protein